MDESAGALDGRLTADQVKQEQAISGLRSKEEGEDQDEETSALKEWVELLVRAGFWALLIYLFIFQVSVVHGPSMEPSFEDADKLVIDKVTYRFSSVNRFDVIVFEAIDYDKRLRRSQDYIKRVIGLPNERVMIRGNQVWVDDRRIQEPFLPGSEDGAGSGIPTTFWVPPGHYFVMGDNRGTSHDSRSAGLGFVPEGQIKGLVRVRWWPWGRVSWFGRLQ